MMMLICWVFCFMDLRFWWIFTDRISMNHRWRFVPVLDVDVFYVWRCPSKAEEAVPGELSGRPQWAAWAAWWQWKACNQLLYSCHWLMNCCTGAPKCGCLNWATITELPPADLSLKQHKQQYQPTKTVMCLLLVDPIEERGHRNNGRRDLAIVWVQDVTGFTSVVCSYCIELQD